MKKKVKMVPAEFIKDHVFFLRGTKRCIKAEYMKKKGVKINLPQNYWDDFAVKGIIKCTATQLKASKKRLGIEDKKPKSAKNKKVS